MKQNTKNLLKRYAVKGKEKKLLRHGESRIVLIDRVMLNALDWDINGRVRVRVEKDRIVVEKA